jgi:serine/threonine protein kinase
MSEATTACPKCGAAIPPEAPQGLCPKCLLKQASFPTETGPTTRHSRPAPPDRDELAAAFPHLQILELIGQGGMGFVYKARQPKLDRLVALKILAQPLAEQTHFAERFTREGRTLAKLNHPNIVTIHDFGQAGPFFYLLMEYVDGVNLRQAMRAGAVNSTQALAIVPRICEALQYAHNEGVLHRDIKPDNILLDTRGRIKIADFGIAKLMAEAVAENPLTGSGASLGTPHYMAPEQIEKPNSVDHRADIYSLGVVFYEMLTGELPLGRFAAPSETSGIDPRLDDVVFQTLEKQPERRPQSADEVRTRVENISSTTGAPQQPAGHTEGTVTFKMARCYLTTPQFLRTRLGRLLRYTNKGELRLDEDTLTFAPRHQNWIVIPLRAITSLSIGDFPAGISKLKFISVTFTEKGNTHRFFFVPTRGGLRSIWNTNELVEEWFNAIRHAAKARAGRIPPSSPDDLDPLPTARKPEFLPAFIKIALIFIAVPLFILGGMLGLYALLRDARQQPNAPSTQPNAPLNAALTPPLIGPTKTLHLAFDYFGPSPEHNINLKGAADLANDEFLTTAIRYNDADWSFERFTSTWDTEEKLARLHWPIPENFSIPFDLEPVVTAFFRHSPAIPIQLSTNGPLTLFTVTNAVRQRITLGIAYRIAPATNATPKLSNFAFRRAINGFDMPGVALLPPGTGLEAWDTYAGGSPRSVRITRDMPGGINIAWKHPADFPANDIGGPPSMGRLFSPPFDPRFTNSFVDLSTEKVEVFAIPNGHDETKVWRGFLKIVAVVPERASNFLAALPSSQIKSNSPPQRNPPTEKPETETLELALGRRSVEPRRIFMQGFAPLTLDQNIVAFVHYPSGPDAFDSTRRTSRFPAPAIPMEGALGFPYSSGENLNVWRTVRGATNSESADFFWNFDEKFSLERDLSPAVDRFFENQNQKKIRLTANERTSLFRITNAFGQIAECALEFRKGIATVKDRSAGVILTSFSGRTNTQSIYLACGVAFPEKMDIQAIGTFDNKPVISYITRNLDGNGGLQCYWLYPEGFIPPLSHAATTNQTASTTTVAMPSVPSYSQNPIFDRLSQRVRSGDARITPSVPLEVFALTNADGKMFRGTLEMSRGR